jgi:ABC-type sugar transport system substrate-binding protein
VRKFIIAFKTLVFVASCLTLAVAYSQSTAPDIVTVVKLTGVGWFSRMEQGVNQFMTSPGANGRKTVQTGPVKADSTQQVAMVQAAVDQGAKAVVVVPLDPPALEATFKAAMAKGVKVVTHEAESQRYTHVNLEAFSNAAFGARLNERLAKCMGGEGKWTVFVGTISSQSHIQWADGGIDNARKLHPKMQLAIPKQSLSTISRRHTSKPNRYYVSIQTSRASKAALLPMYWASVAPFKRRVCKTKPACSAQACHPRPLPCYLPGRLMAWRYGIQKMLVW